MSKLRCGVTIDTDKSFIGWPRGGLEAETKKKLILEMSWNDLIVGSKSNYCSINKKLMNYDCFVSFLEFGFRDLQLGHKSGFETRSFCWLMT
jgi:hypothetical protein